MRDFENTVVSSSIYLTMSTYVYFRNLSSISEAMVAMMTELDVWTPIRACLEKYFDNDQWMEQPYKYDEWIFSYTCDVIASLW